MILEGSFSEYMIAIGPCNASNSPKHFVRMAPAMVGCCAAHGGNPYFCSPASSSCAYLEGAPYTASCDRLEPCSLPHLPTGPSADEIMLSHCSSNLPSPLAGATRYLHRHRRRHSLNTHVLHRGGGGHMALLAIQRVQVLAHSTALRGQRGAALDPGL